MMTRSSIVIILAGAAEIAAPAFAQQPQFKSMGKPPPGLYTQESFIIPLACSPAGEVGGGNSGSPILWHPLTGYKTLQSSKPDKEGYVTDFVGWQDVPVGTANYDNGPRPVRWPDRDGPPVAIPGFPVDEWVADQLSLHANADGSVIVGKMYHRQNGTSAIWIWRSGVRKNQGWEFITQFPPGKAGVGFGDLSDHAAIAVGGSRDLAWNFEAMRWSKSTGFVFDGDLPGGVFESAYNATDALGLVAVGAASPAQPGLAAVRWTARGGMLRLDENAPPPIAGYATGFYDSDHSGFVHVGAVLQGGKAHALAWNPLDGMYSTKETLIEIFGLNEVSGWNLYSVRQISPEGRFMTGIGYNPQGVPETWWAEIRPFCYADCDRASTPKGGEAVLNVDDFICYVTHFVMDDLYANCNNDAELDIDDFICFQTAFSLGC